MSRKCSQQGESTGHDGVGQGVPLFEGTSHTGVESGATSNFEVSRELNCESFERHLDPVIRTLIAGHGICNLIELVDYTEAIETKWKELLEVRRTWVWKPRSSSTEASSSLGDVVELGKKRQREDVQPSTNQQGHKPLGPLAKPGVSLRRQIICHKCGESGHFRNKCSKSGKAPSKCYICGQPDHVSRNCPMRETTRGSHG